MLEAGSQPSNVVPYEGLNKNAATIGTMLTEKACSIKDTQCVLRACQLAFTLNLAQCDTGKLGWSSDPVIHIDDVSLREPSLVDSPLASTLKPATQRFTQPCGIRLVRMTGACVCMRSKFRSKILVHSWTWSGPPHCSHITCKSSRMPISRFSFLRDLPIGFGRP